jgi:DNA polymerase elongation subunit (family B)
VQLAERMRRRGKPVAPGTRLEYVVIGDSDEKLFDKMEDVEYFQAHKSVLQIDYLYYLRLAINPIDQALEVAYNVKNFMQQQHKYRLQKQKCLRQLLKYFSTEVVFE